MKQTDTRFWSYLAQFLLEWEMFYAKVVEEIKNTHFVSSNVFLENRAVYEIRWKNIEERGRPHEGMVHAHCLLDT